MALSCHTMSAGRVMTTFFIGQTATTKTTVGWCFVSVCHNIKLVQPSAIPADYLPDADSYYEFEPVPAEDAEELMTYELTIPYKERNRFEEFLHKIGIPVSALKKVVNHAAVF